MEWTEDMVTRLRVLWAEGRPTAEIGRAVGISKNAVVGKAHRLGLVPRPSPIRREASGVVVLAAEPEASALAATDPAEVPAPPGERAGERGRKRVAPAAHLVSRGVSARTVACCWPIGEPATPGFHFCGSPALPGKPYCAAHAELAYVRVRERRDDAA